MNFKYIIAALFFFSICSCNSDKRQYVDMETIDALIKRQNPDVEHVVMIYNNDIYYLDNLKKTGRRITSF